MHKLPLVALAAFSLTGLAACGSGDTNTSSGRDAFLKGCTSGAPAGVSKAAITKFCGCAVDELRAKGLNTGDELQKAQKARSTDYLAAIQTCGQKYLARGY